MCVCVRISPSGWDGPRLKWPLPPLLLSSLNVVCSREAVSEKHHLGISDHFSSHVFWKWARWATKGGKKIPYGSFVPRSSFSKACWGKLREWNSALGYPWSTGRGSSFVATWGLCDCAYLFASLTGMCRLILSFGERRLAKEGWPDSFVLAISLSARRIFSLFCLGFVFIFSFKVVVVVVVNIFCRSIGGHEGNSLSDLN